MSEYKKVKIGDFLTEREGRYKPDDEKISNYKRLEKIDFSGVIHISDKVSKTDMIIVHPGDLVISGINVAKGAVAVFQGNEPVCATIHYSSYTFDDKQVDLEYFKYFVKSDAFISALQKQVKGGIKTEIKPKHLLPLEITIPDLETQEEIVKKVSINLKNVETLTKEIESQKAYAKQLRQNILQDAIEGKLTAEWRKTHPVVKGNPEFDAEALFEEIQKEKKSDKKQKELAPIGDDEKPFEIPEGWKWVRIRTICNIQGGKRVSNGYKLLTTPTNHIYIRVSDMKNGTIDDSDLHYIDDEMFEKIKKYIITTDDIYMTIVGATIGKCGLVPEKFNNMNLTENAARLTPLLIDKQFFFEALTSDFLQRQFIEKTKKVGVEKMALNRFGASVLPLPPLKEQEEIVNKVESLLDKITELEKQIQERKQLSEKLVFGVIKEKLER